MLADGEVVAAFLLAEPRSHLWVIDREGLSHHPLPGTGDIETITRRAFADLINPASTPDLERLSDLLLGPCSSKCRWTA